MDILLEAIARKHLRIPTLQSRGRDSLDFHEFSVSTLERALQAALDLGKAIGKSDSTSTLTWRICVLHSVARGNGFIEWLKDDTSPDGVMHFDNQQDALQCVKALRCLEGMKSMPSNVIYEVNSTYALPNL